MNNQNTIAEINAKITTNNDNQITGEMVRDCMLSMVGLVSDGYVFGGLASDNPNATPTIGDSRVFFLYWNSTESTQTLVGYGGISVAPHTMVAVTYDTDWSALVLGAFADYGTFVVLKDLTGTLVPANCDVIFNVYEQDDTITMEDSAEAIRILNGDSSSVFLQYWNLTGNRLNVQRSQWVDNGTTYVALTHEYMAKATGGIQLRKQIDTFRKVSSTEYYYDKHTNINISEVIQ